VERGVTAARLAAASALRTSKNISDSMAQSTSGWVGRRGGRRACIMPGAHVSRRKFFLLSLAGGAAVSAPVTQAEAYDPGEERTKSRYQETEHVKAFYRTNGYETLKK
jgi:hypothetical protein